MTSRFSQISDTALFSLLIAVFVGWTAFNVATDRTTPSVSASSSVARIAATSSNS